MHSVLPYGFWVSCQRKAISIIASCDTNTYLLITFSSWVKWSRRWRFLFGFSMHISMLEPVLLILLRMLKGDNLRGMFFVEWIWLKLSVTISGLIICVAAMMVVWDKIQNKLFSSKLIDSYVKGFSFVRFTILARHCSVFDWRVKWVKWTGSE